MERMIEDLYELDGAELARLETELRRRLRDIARNGQEPVQYRPDVIEYRPHEDGHLQAETRTYFRKDGSTNTHGPYWYFRFHEGGRQKKIYIGKTDDPEAALEQKRVERRSS